MSRRKIYTTTKALPLACLLAQPLAADWSVLITVAVYRDTDWDEYQCFYRVDGHPVTSNASGIMRSLFMGAHHTDNKADAIRTADTMVASLARNPHRKPLYLLSYREGDSPQAVSGRTLASCEVKAHWQTEDDIDVNPLDAPEWLPSGAMHNLSGWTVPARAYRHALTHC